MNRVPPSSMNNQPDCLIQKYASILLALRTSCFVRSVEVQKGCLFVHAEIASEALRTRLLRDFETEGLSDLRVAVSVNPALRLAEVNGRLATGVGTIGALGGGLEVGAKLE